MARNPRIPKDLPEGHLIVLDLLATLDEGNGVSWERLREEAAAKGIGANELHMILVGAPLPEGA